MPIWGLVLLPHCSVFYLIMASFIVEPCLVDTLQQGEYAKFTWFENGYINLLKLFI